MAYNLGPVKAHVRATAETVGPKFGIKVIYGWRPFDAISQDHPNGDALDYMTSSMATGSALAEYHVVNADALGVRYIIWNRKIWSRARASEGWRVYTGSNPHTDHVHVTYEATPGSMNLVDGATPLGNPITAAQDTLAKLEKLFSLIADTNTWIRVSMFIGGILFIAIGVLGASRVKAEAATMAKTLGKVIK